MLPVWIYFSLYLCNHDHVFSDTASLVTLDFTKLGTSFTFKLARDFNPAISSRPNLVLANPTFGNKRSQIPGGKQHREQAQSANESNCKRNHSYTSQIDGPDLPKCGNASIDGPDLPKSNVCKIDGPDSPKCSACKIDGPDLRKFNYGEINGTDVPKCSGLAVNEKRFVLNRPISGHRIWSVGEEQTLSQARAQRLLTRTSVLELVTRHYLLCRGFKPTL